jgi:hypothetical protein
MLKASLHFVALLLVAPAAVIGCVLVAVETTVTLTLWVSDDPQYLRWTITNPLAFDLASHPRSALG